MSFSTKTALLALSVAGASALLCCCVNDDYDLTKDFDKSVTIDGDIAAPLGNSEMIRIGDLLDIDTGDMGILSVAPDGDYSLEFSGNSVATTFSIPPISATGNLVDGGGFHAGIDRSSIFRDMGITSADVPIPSGVTINHHIEASSSSLNIDAEVPEEIIDIKSVAGKATGTVSFRTNVGKATLTGLSIDFPDYLLIAVSSDNDDIRYSFDGEKNVLAFEPVEMSGTQRTVNLEISGIDFSKISSGQGFLASERRIYVNDGIGVSEADVKILSDDLGDVCSDIPEEIEIDLGISVGTVEINAATIKVNPKVDIEPAKVTVGDYPEFVKGNEAVLDLYDPQISIEVGNGSPISFSLDADIKSYADGTETAVHIGGRDSATEDININANGDTRIFISRTGNDVPEGYDGIRVPDLPDLVKNLPEQMEIANVDVAAKDEFITVHTGVDYSFKCGYSISAPLSFGKDLKFTYDTDFTGWNEAFESEKTDMEIKDVEVRFNLVNTIPLGIGISAAAIDKNAELFPAISLTVDATVAAGSIDSPSTTPVTLSLKGSAEDIRKLDGIRLYLAASGTDGAAEGVCLNEKQGIRLDDMKLRLQGRLTAGIE